MTTTVADFRPVLVQDQSKLNHITVTQPVNLDQVETDVAAAKAKTDLLTVPTAVNLGLIDSAVAAHDNYIALLQSQATAVDTFIGRSSSSYGLISGGADNRAALNTLMSSLATGSIVRLPAGTFWVNGGGNVNNVVTFKSGCRFIGHPLGTTFVFTAPTGSQSPFRLSSNLTLEDIVFKWDIATPPGAGSDCALVMGDSLQAAADNLKIRRCSFFGPADTTGAIPEGSQLYWLGSCTPISLRGCNTVYLEDVEVAYATGTQYGMEVIGGSYHQHVRVRAHHNAADGIKILGDGYHGRPDHFRFSDCEGYGNGQTAIQGQNANCATSTITTTTTLTPVNGARYRLNPTAAAINLTLNNGTVAGTKFLLSKVRGSQDVVVKDSGGSTLFTWSMKDDSAVARMTWSGSAWTGGGRPSNPDWYTNGEAWDVGAGVDFCWTNCVARDNESTGFQCKPQDVSFGTAFASGSYTAGQLVAYNGNVYRAKVTGTITSGPPDATYWEKYQPSKISDHRFVGCASYGSWSGNGFGVVNNIDTANEVPPQNVSYVDCVAADNFGSGFIIATPTSTGFMVQNVAYDGCISRSNGGDGFQVQHASRFVSLDTCYALGNGCSKFAYDITKIYNLYDTVTYLGKTYVALSTFSNQLPTNATYWAQTANGWAIKIFPVTGVRIVNCFLSGLDPVRQELTTTALADDASYATSYGLFLEKTYTATSPNFTMSDVVVANCRFHKHLFGTDLAFYRNVGAGDVAALSTDFDQSIVSSRLTLGTNSNGVLTFTGQQSASLGGTNSSRVTFT